MAGSSRITRRTFLTTTASAAAIEKDLGIYDLKQFTPKV